MNSRTFATQGDADIAKFLSQEISTEKSNQKPLPRLEGWTASMEGSEVTLTKSGAGGEKLILSLNVNHTVDSAEPDDGQGEAPEMLSRGGVEYKGPEVDIWSSGVVLFALLTGHLPFPGASPKEIRASILAGRYTIPNFVSETARDLLTHMLCLDRHARFTMEDIQEHEWYQGTAEAPLRSVFEPRHSPVQVGSSPAAPSKPLLSTAFVLRELGKENCSPESNLSLQRHSKGISTVRKIRSKVAAFDANAIVQKALPAESISSSKAARSDDTTDTFVATSKL